MAQTSVISTEVSEKNTVRRNYQLDFLKFIFTIFVFLFHTSGFVGENTRISFPPALGFISVHFFFVVSGMLMVNSIIGSNVETSNPGKSAMQFVIKKFKAISIPYWVALFLFVSIYYIYIYIYIYIYNISDTPLKSFFVFLSRIFPEAFVVTQSGVLLVYNGVTWYISAMFIVMLPMAYMLYKHRDLFLYVLAPLTAVMILGYYCQKYKFGLDIGNTTFSGIVLEGVIRALCGLCFGVVAWLIYKKLHDLITKKSQMILATVLEVFLWFTFFATWFILRDTRSIYSVLFILPIAVAITFSRKSYICRLFEFKWMRFLSPVSLAIYLNHWIACNLVNMYFSDRSYKFCVSIIALFTAVICLIYCLLIKLCRFLWDRKLKRIFSNQVD